MTQLMVLETEGGLPGKQITGKNQGLPEPQTSISFPEIQYPRSGKEGEGRTLCVCGCFKGLWDFNEDNKSLLLSLYDF